MYRGSPQLVPGALPRVGECGKRSGNPETTAMDKPNVLLVCVEQWPGRLLGCAGHPVISTPTLDQLARNGVRFTNAYSAVPVCVPARKALLSGTTPKTHRDRTFNEQIPMPRPTIADAFVAGGY